MVYPMSGGRDDFNTTLQAVSIADIINKELKLKDKHFSKLPVLISGGTNTLQEIWQDNAMFHSLALLLEHTLAR